jgi:hypothetical protein
MRATPGDIEAVLALDVDRMILGLPPAAKDEVFTILASYADTVATYQTESESA